MRRLNSRKETPLHTEADRYRNHEIKRRDEAVTLKHPTRLHLYSRNSRRTDWGTTSEQGPRYSLQWDPHCVSSDCVGVQRITIHVMNSPPTTTFPQSSPPSSPPPTPHHHQQHASHSHSCSPRCVSWDKAIGWKKNEREKKWGYLNADPSPPYYYFVVPPPKKQRREAGGLCRQCWNCNGFNHLIPCLSAVFPLSSSPFASPPWAISAPSLSPPLSLSVCQRFPIWRCCSSLSGLLLLSATPPPLL